MPFVDVDPVSGPLALPDGFDLNPDQEESDTSLWAAAFRLENPIVSAVTSFNYSRSKPFDPDYQPWNDIQGTVYEQYSDRFVEARDVDDVGQMKAQIDREMSDRAVIDASGGWGFMAEMGAAILSPSSLLPGGAVVRGAAGGIKIGKTVMSVSLSAGAAAAMDEFALQQSQVTRTDLESGLAIGGSMILGGLLGGASGALTQKVFTRAADAAEQLPAAMDEFHETLNSVGAADAAVDMTLRRENVFQALNKIAGLRGLVRSDPILRAQLSDNVEVRRALSGLVETPLQYAANEAGQSVTANLPGGVSAETAIKTRRNNELAQSFSDLNRAFVEYANDGPVGMVGRFTAPVTARYGHLLGADRKLNMTDFMREVGSAAMRSDTHPIPQVQKAAEMIRANIFNRIKDDAIDLGIFDADLQVKYGESYFMRVYNNQKIAAHMGDGSDQDISTLLRREFARKRSEAEIKLGSDRTVSNLENDVFSLKESIRTSQRAFETAQNRAKGKAGRAKATIKREGAVGRVSAALRKDFKARSKGLSERTLAGSEKEAFKQMIKNAGRVDKMEPPDIFKAISRLGGIKDDGSGELAAALDQRLLSVKRNDGMDPDEMRGALSEMGYLPDGLTVNEFYEILRSANDGEKVYSRQEFGPEIEAFEAAVEFRDTLDDLGIDTDGKSVDEIMDQMPEFARNQSTTRAKATEAGRGATKAGEKVDASEARLLKAIDRLEDAEARLAELDEVVSPKVRQEVKAARETLSDLLPELKKAKKAQSADEYYAGLDDLEIQSSVEDAVNSLLGLKPGEHSYQATLSSPTRARTMDVADELLEPWLETDMSTIMMQYFNSVVPDMEIIRRFGDLEMTAQKTKIIDEKDRLVRNATTDKQRNAHVREAEIRTKELDNMRDRIRGTYGAPDDPKDVWVRGLRATRTVSYMGYLGGMTLSAIPDVAGVIGRNGIEAAFGGITAFTDPKRLGLAVKDAADMGAAAEWWLNSRAISMSEVMDPYGANTKFERGLGQAAQSFGVATGMVPWNAAWKSLGGAFVSSKMAKAAVAVAEGTASKSDLLKLSENGIDTATAQRIAAQVQEFGDTEGQMWLPRGQDWTDKQAFEAFRNAMNREIDIMIVTPGQDKPIAWSSEVGKFFSQFKSFAVSSHHRILLSGIQRADASVLAQFTTAVILGGLVANIKADIGGYNRKEGTAFWEDAIDRSGLAGWLFEAHGLANGFTGGRLSISGEEVSRYQSRSSINGVLGPSVDMAANLYEGVSAVARGDHNYRDIRKVMRPLPGNNIPYLMPLFRQIEDSMVEMTDAKPRTQ